MEYYQLDQNNRQTVNEFIIQHWYTTKMVVHGKIFDMAQADGIVACDSAEIIGLLTYIIEDDRCEILSLDSLMERKGIGTALIGRLILQVRQMNCHKITVTTTNDNINAIRFYQKRGFDMVHLYHNALEISRKLKPEIPFIGENEIPLRHEIEFEIHVDCI